jgi:mannosylglycerate hydrolase
MSRDILHAFAGVFPSILKGSRMTAQLNIILVPHTHWDREWYQTFQQFRMRLVHAVDRLLDILDRDDGFTYFMLDGQTIVLDDYLEIQPEQEERLRRYTRSGRILTGPWYIQPDEFLVSGESLIRNLQIGLRRAAMFGEPMRVGYVPDCFGHIAQLPQILQGFGIDNAVFWRGVGSEARQSEFYWAAPDGTSVLVIHLADPAGYSNANNIPLPPKEFAARAELLAAQILPQATTNTLLFMNGSDHREPQDGLPAAIAAANERLARVNSTQEQWQAIVSQPSASPDGLRSFDGINVRIGTLPQYISAVREELARQNGQQSDLPLQTLSGEMRSSQFAHLLPGVLSTRMWIKQQNNATEHLLERWVEPLTAWAWKLGAPYPAGLVNVAWRYLLQNHPHDSICGCSIDQVHRENAVRFAQSRQIAEGVIAHAMQYLAASVDTRPPVAAPHTHYQPAAVVVFNPTSGPRTETVQATVQFPGSLRNAAVIDEQGRHMPFTVVNRWRKVIGSTPIPREQMATAIALVGEFAPGQLIEMAEETITTMLGQEQTNYSIVRMHIDTTQEQGVAHVEIMVAGRSQTAQADQALLEAEQQLLAVARREDIHTLEATVIDQARETLEFVAQDLPAYGLKTFWVYPRGLHGRDEAESAPAGLSGRDESAPTGAPTGAMASGARSIENEWFRVEADANDGTLTVTDKQTGAVLNGLNRFVGGGDVGDLYNYCPPTQDTLISQPLESPKIEIIDAAPVALTLRVSGRYALPASCTADRANRSARTVTCQISSEIRLVSGVRRIDIHTSVDNRARDHRLRVLFPVSYTVENVAAEGTFEVRQRPVNTPRPTDTSAWTEEPVNTFPQKSFVVISDGTTGLGVLNRGLPEAEIVSAESSAINREATGQTAVALTLLRCVEWLSRGDLSNRRGHAGPQEFTPEAQCLGHHEFDYALVPHPGDWRAEDALVQREAHAFNAPPRAVVVPVATPEAAQLPPTASLVDVSPGSLVVSALKRGVDGRGLIIRVYNPLPEPVTATIRPGIAFSQAYMTNLQEEQQAQLAADGAAGEPLTISLRAGEIATVQLL